MNSAFVAQTQNPLIVSSGIVGYWSFNDYGAGNIVRDFCGNANFTNGTIAGSGGTWVPGKTGQAFNCNGTSGINVADSAYLRPGTGNWAMVYWVKTLNVNFAGNVFVGKRNNESGYVQLTSGGGGVNSGGGAITGKGIFIFQYAGSISYRTTANVIDGNWHHVVAIRPSSGTPSIYIDGVNQSLTVDSGGGPDDINNTDIWQFGGANNGSFNNILLDEVRLYNRVLNQGEVTALYMAGFNGLHVAVANWRARVVANGGGEPLGTTLSALSTFMSGLDSSGLTPKLFTVNCMVPDSLVACMTPLVKIYGNDPWTNYNFVAGDLTVNGLKGNSSNKGIDTGITLFSTIATGASISAISYNVQSGSGDTKDLNAAATNRRFRSGYASGGNGNYFCSFGDVNTLYDFYPGWFQGYKCCSKTASNRRDIYLANSTLPHSSSAFNTGVDAGGADTPPNGYTVWAYAGNEGGIHDAYSGECYSFFALGLGLQASESSTLYNLVQVLRTSLGGGYV